MSLCERVEVRRYLYLDISGLACGNITGAIFILSGFYGHGALE